MSDDKQLKQAVLDELSWDPSVNAAHIGVTTKAGVVTLMGHVESYAEKSAAEKAAKRVKDVKAVAEELEVRLPFSNTHGDDVTPVCLPVRSITTPALFSNHRSLASVIFETNRAGALCIGTRKFRHVLSALMERQAEGTLDVVALERAV